ncbi:MAG: sigma-70 family RNA polymerase sigma factor [Clostridia bacterium]|nr:sigma-70 family RNA polymerase sigma factor [Clostridia bacterium]
MDERETVGASGRLDDARFEELYSRYADDVLRVSYFYLGNREQAEDVTQDVFVRLLTAAPILKPGSEKSWLLKVALNRCRDLWRSAWARRVLVGSPTLELIPDPDDVEDSLEKRELLQAVHRLPASFREIILMYYYQEFSIAEIADILEVPEGTVSSRLSRARKKLEEMLKGSASL